MTLIVHWIGKHFLIRKYDYPHFDKQSISSCIDPQQKYFDNILFSFDQWMSPWAMIIDFTRKFKKEQRQPLTSIDFINKYESLLLTNVLQHGSRISGFNMHFFLKQKKVIHSYETVSGFLPWSKSIYTR